jgi:hypothetical protein
MGRPSLRDLKNAVSGGGGNKQKYRTIKQEELDTTEESYSSDGGYDDDDNNSYTAHDVEWAETKSHRGGVRRPRYIVNALRNPAPETRSCRRGFCWGVVITAFVMTLVMFAAWEYDIARVEVDMEQLNLVVNNTVQTFNKAIQDERNKHNKKKHEKVDGAPTKESQDDQGDDLFTEENNEGQEAEAGGDEAEEPDGHDEEPEDNKDEGDKPEEEDRGDGSGDKGE